MAPIQRENVWAKGDLVRSGFSIDVHPEMCGIFEVKRRLALGKLRRLLSLNGPATKQVHPLAEPLQWASQKCPRARHFFRASILPQQ